jgi:hypothetical protein
MLKKISGYSLNVSYKADLPVIIFYFPLNLLVQN